MRLLRRAKHGVLPPYYVYGVLPYYVRTYGALLQVVTPKTGHPHRKREVSSFISGATLRRVLGIEPIQWKTSYLALLPGGIHVRALLSFGLHSGN